MLKHHSALIFFGLLAALLSQNACHKSSPQAQPNAIKPIRFLISAPLRQKMDPYNLVQMADYLIALQLWTPLIELDSGSFTPSSLARKWSRSPDALEWTFELKPDLKWSDGKPLTAQDIVSSLKYSISRETFLSKIVKKIVLADEKRIRFVLHEPSELFMPHLGSTRHVISEMFRSKTPLDFSQKKLRSTGAFRLADAREGTVLLEPNPHFVGYTKDLPPAAEISGNLTVSEIIAKLISGEGDMTRINSDLLSKEELEDIRRAGIREFKESDQNSFAALQFGKKGLSELTSLERRAVLKALSPIPVTPPHGTGYPDRAVWNKALDEIPAVSKKIRPLEVFVMKTFQKSQAYQKALDKLRAKGIPVREVVYDPAKPESKNWLRRSSHDYDLMFIYFSFSREISDSDVRWAQLAKFLPQSPFSAEELDSARKQNDPDKRQLAYQEFEMRNVRDPFIITLDLVGYSLLFHESILLPEATEKIRGPMQQLWRFRRKSR